MGRFLLRRLLAVPPVVLGVSAVIFLLVQLAPGDATAVLLGPQASVEARAQLRRSLGLDRPLPVQYGAWLARTVSGDFGTSVATQRPVASLVGQRFGNTLLLTAASLLLAALIGAGVGFFAALRAGSAFDRAAVAVTLVTGSTPQFWLGLILVLAFAIELRWLPVSGMRDLAGEGGALDVARHLVLPAVTAALGPAAIIARVTRAAILEALARPHVRVARAKGLPRGALLGRHVVLNALPPVVTVTGLQLGYLIGGALLVEVVFAWPGLGALLYDSITARDLPVIQATSLVIALGFVLANIGVDALNAVLDPRLRDA